MTCNNSVIVEINEKTAIITINKEGSLNALDSDLLDNLSSVLDSLATNNTIRGVVLKGAGTKSFAAGADIKEFVGMTSDDASLFAAKVQMQVMDKIAFFPKPIVAAVNGYALGGGLELAMACHIRVAVSSARFGLPEVTLGIIPGYGGTQRLCQLIGRGRALEMIITGKMIDVEEALSYGLVNHIVSYEDLIPKCEEILEKSYACSPHAISFAIEAVNNGIIDSTLGYKREIELFGKSFTTSDAKEGIQAFIEKRKPKF